MAELACVGRAGRVRAGWLLAGAVAGEPGPGGRRRGVLGGAGSWGVPGSVSSWAWRSPTG